MPITQDRLISLLDLISQTIDRERVIFDRLTPLQIQIGECYRSNQDLDDKLEQLFSLALEATEKTKDRLPTLDPDLMANFYREQEHFRLSRKRNTQAKATMTRLRQRGGGGSRQKESSTSNIPSEEEMIRLVELERQKMTPSAQPPESNYELEETDWSKVRQDDWSMGKKSEENRE